MDTTGPAGVDEAGKGAVIGPMVIAAVGCADRDLLDRIGVRDSKSLTPRARERIAPLLLEEAESAVVILDAAEIDRQRQWWTMNICAARGHAAAIRMIGAREAIADACDVNAARYAGILHDLLDGECRIHAEHHADLHHPVVAAAGILAKVVRDAAIRDLALVHGRIGSGYPSDTSTIRYLEEYMEVHRAPPPFARASWATVRRIAGSLAPSTGEGEPPCGALLSPSPAHDAQY